MSNQTSLQRLTPSQEKTQALCLKGEPMTLEEVSTVASGQRKVTITDDSAVLRRLHRGTALVGEAVASGARIYGLTTGFGSMADVPVSSDDAALAQVNLLEFLSSGAGKPIAREHVRATMVLRANMLLQGASGVRLEIIERLVKFLNADATPVVPELGSIGASGDLVPLGAIARAITGQATPCRVNLGDREVSRDEALAALDLEPLELFPKEALAIVNGTTFSAAVGVNCYRSAKNFLALSFAVHAMMTRALLGHEDPFAPFVHQCKPHRGQKWAADMMRRLLASPGTTNGSTANHSGDHLQDRYSIRCLPQYMGPIVDGFLRIEESLEIEMNAVTDNPLIDVDSCDFFQSGNFLGQYVGIAMDELRKYVGLLAKHLDTQIALVVAPEFNHGLPPSLASEGDSPINMNLKGLQITGNSILPMLTHLGNPLVEHFPTHAEHFNQNVNSLSWGSAQLASQSVEMASHYAAVALIFGVQAIDMRAARVHPGNYDGRTLINPTLCPLYEAVYEAADRTPDGDAPLVNNEAPNLELSLASIASSIRENGAIPKSVSRISDSLREARLMG